MYFGWGVWFVYTGLCYYKPTSRMVVWLGDEHILDSRNPIDGMCHCSTVSDKMYSNAGYG